MAWTLTLHSMGGCSQHLLSPSDSTLMRGSSLSIADRHHSVIGKPINANIIICPADQSPWPSYSSSTPPQLRTLLCLPGDSKQPLPVTPWPCHLHALWMDNAQLQTLSTPLAPPLLPHQSWRPDKQLCTLPATPIPPHPSRAHSNVLQVAVHLTGLGSVPFLWAGREVFHLPHSVFILPIPTLPDLPLTQPRAVATCPSRGLFLHLPHENIGSLSKTRETEEWVAFSSCEQTFPGL